jgi:hypothetical protein
MKTTQEGSKGHQKTPYHSGPREDARWDRLAPPPCHPVPYGVHLLGASKMFLHRLLGLHLRRSLSRFDPRARVAPPGLQIQALSHPKILGCDLENTK